MYHRAQIWICFIPCLASLSSSLIPQRSQESANASITGKENCPLECICLSPKQVLCNTGGLKDVPTSHLPNTVEDLSLSKNDFPLIKSDAFVGLKSLLKLNLDGNNIAHIKHFAFRGLSKLQELSIQHTPLEYIGQFSFAGLQNVTVLLLTNNRIKYIEENSFAGTSNIKIILLSNNPLVSIRSNAFSGLTYVERLIFPSGIRNIEPDAFNGLQNVGLLKLTFMDLTILQTYTFRGLAYVQILSIQESDLGTIQKDAFKGLSHVDTLNILNNKIDFIEQLNISLEHSVSTFLFRGNHVLEAPKPGHVNLQVKSIMASGNHFPCDCQIHIILESDFANGSIIEFRKHNFCISPLEYNAKPMSFVNFDLIAKCHDMLVKDSLGSGNVNAIPFSIIIIAFCSFIDFSFT